METHLRSPSAFSGSHRSVVHGVKERLKQGRWRMPPCSSSLAFSADGHAIMYWPSRKAFEVQFQRLCAMASFIASEIVWAPANPFLTSVTVTIVKLHNVSFPLTISLSRGRERWWMLYLGAAFSIEISPSPGEARLREGRSSFAGAVVLAACPSAVLHRLLPASLVLSHASGGALPPLATRGSGWVSRIAYGHKAKACWEKAEVEALALKQQLESNTMLKLIVEEQATHLDSALKECVKQIRTEIHSLKYEPHIVSKELEIHTEEKNKSIRSAEVANKQHTKDVKKITKARSRMPKITRSYAKDGLAGLA
ncbi:hypothetical protein J5N97_028360 [Dioscorea zingiberensis]|uniref:Uncharacterized protein n=1 Tax=Dioscorea zingiberensis TaxID=325984 RepID=A0A9D5BYU4_9LILI|nr:hypothetical protein J5N97_028360 [Dioscorea zingiberensis]